jgi:hypothetical protein
MNSETQIAFMRHSSARPIRSAGRQRRTLKLRNEPKRSWGHSGMSGLAFRNKAKFPAEEAKKSRENPGGSQISAAAGRALEHRGHAEGRSPRKKQNQQIKANLLKRIKGARVWQSQFKANFGRQSQFWRWGTGSPDGGRSH